MNVNDVLKTAAAEIGYHEGSNNNNKYGKEYGLNNQPWCVIFLWWCFKHTLDGAKEKLSDFMPNSAHCNGVRSFALNIDRWYPRSEIGLHVDIQPGDLVIWDNNGDNSGDHIGIVETVTNNNAFTTIEGNHSDAVCRVNRSFSNVMGVYKPLYDFDFREAENAGGASPSPTGSKAEDAGEETPHPSAAPTPSPQGEGNEKAFLQIGSTGFAVGVLQYALHKRGYDAGNSRQASGDWDGEYGEGTQLALDRFCNRNGAVCTEELFIEICKGAKRK